MKTKKNVITSLLLLTLFTGCSSLSSREEKFLKETSPTQKEATFEVDKSLLLTRQQIEDTKQLDIYDPWEPFNRRMYYFNYYADTYVVQPVANTYEFIVPSFIRTGVSNFFNNFQDIYTLLNSILQLKPEKAMLSLARVAVNSTVGLLGVVDVATMLDFPRAYEDFGLTLARYGVGQGPYLVLPLLGPSNLRDASGLAVGSYGLNKMDLYHPLDIDMYSPEISVLKGVDTRYKIDFKYYNSGTPFEYEYMRFFYFKYREALEKK
jgi:phospholipid-binding lipoprotein MlaA